MVFHARLAIKSLICGLVLSVLIMPVAVYPAEAAENGAQALQKVAQEYYSRGLDYAQHNQFDFAIRQYDQAIALDPGSADFYLKRGEAHRKNRQIDQSIGDFTKAIELQPENCEAYLARAISYAANNQYDRAIADMKQAVEVSTEAIRRNPQDAAKYADRGQVYMFLNDYGNAEIDFSKVLALTPRSDAAYIRRGTVYVLEYEFDRAIADFSKAIALNDNNDEALLLRGNTYFYWGKYRQAIQDFSAAIALKPADPVAYAARGCVYMMSGDEEKGRQDCRKAESIDKKTAVLTMQRMTVGAISYSHIIGNVPEKGDFDRLLLQAIKAYFHTGPNGEVNYELLREGPDQVGVSPPDYYLWLEINDNGNRQVGALHVTAIDKKEFYISGYLPQETIERNFSAVYRIFPLTVCVKIADKIK